MLAAPGLSPENAQPTAGQPPTPGRPVTVVPPTPSSYEAVKPCVAKSDICAPRFAGSSGKHPPAARAPASDDAPQAAMVLAIAACAPARLKYRVSPEWFRSMPKSE